MANPFIGEIKMFGLNFPPVGWAQCNGQLLPIAQNTALFSILGATYGGDGETTLGLPDLRGRFPIHAGTGAGLTPRSLGQKAGTENVALTAATMASHSHSLVHRTSSNVGTLRSPSGNYPGQVIDDPPYAATQTTTNTVNTTAVGSGATHLNMPPYLAVNFCIALVGTFPSEA